MDGALALIGSILTALGIAGGLALLIWLISLIPGGKDDSNDHN